MKRRDFLTNTGLFLGTLPLFSARPAKFELPDFSAKNSDVGDWASIRNQFSLTTSRIHLATFFLTSQGGNSEKNWKTRRRLG